ncbi:MAG: DUF3006 domain-containing protein [Bacillota bacterium]
MLIIDQFKGDWAVIEYERGTFSLPRSLLPPGAREGDVLRLTVAVDSEETARRRDSIKSLEDELFR